MDSQVMKLKEYVEGSRYTVAITGAGISFSAGGLNFEQANLQELMPLASEDTLKGEPDKYYRILDKAFLHSMFQVGPSPAHRALTALEERGKLQGIITTNIDCIHTMAGTRHVAEIQGSRGVNKCMGCGRHYDDYSIWNHGQVPRCGDCGEVIWTFPFYSHIGLNDGEVAKARRWISKAELVLVIGANGSYGAAYWSYMNRRAKIVQINPGETQFDGIAALSIKRDADSVLGELIEAI